MSLGRLPAYLLGQFAGAFLAAVVFYLLFSSSLAHYEIANGIVRGTPESVKTAMMFGEFYPNPGAGPSASVSTWTAFLAEGMGTFVLVFLIFALTEGCNLGRPDNALAPLCIGFTVTIIISVIAPLTQAGLNPARDLSPRIFSMLAGWGKAALLQNPSGFLTVYVLGPVCGGVGASLFFSRIIEPLMKTKRGGDSCLCK
jgi:glycerol uptake facilitator protein